MRTVTVLRPGARRVEITEANIERLRTLGEITPYVQVKDNVFLTSHYVSVAWIDTLNTWKVVDLVSPEQLIPLAKLTKRMERKGH